MCESNEKTAEVREGRREEQSRHGFALISTVKSICDLSILISDYQRREQFRRTDFDAEVAKDAEEGKITGRFRR